METKAPQKKAEYEDHPNTPGITVHTLVNHHLTGTPEGSVVEATIEMEWEEGEPDDEVTPGSRSKYVATDNILAANYIPEDGSEGYSFDPTEEQIDELMEAANSEVI